MSAQPDLTPAQVDNLRFAVRADHMAGSVSARLEDAVLRIVAEDRRKRVAR